MSEDITRFVMQGDIDNATLWQLHEIAMERGLKAASFVLPNLADTTALQDPGEMAVAATETSTQIIKAEKYDLSGYAKSIDFDVGTAGSVWNRMVEQAFKNPVNYHFQFDNIPVRQKRRYYAHPSRIDTVPIAEESTGLNVTRLFEWVQRTQREVAEREPLMTRADFQKYTSGLVGGMNRFKLLANFAYQQMGQDVPYELSTFTTGGRKEKEAVIDETVSCLLTDHVINVQHPLVETVLVPNGWEQPRAPKLGISNENIAGLLAGRQQELGFSNLGRVMGANFSNWKFGRAQTEDKQEACTIEQLLSILADPQAPKRQKEYLCVILGEVLMETPPYK